MKRDEKCVEYYFNSHKYNKIQIIEFIEKEKVAFENKEFKMDIKLNEHGIYVVKLNFLNNENIKFYEAQNKAYGKYKSAGVFQPI